MAGDERERDGGPPASRYVTLLSAAAVIVALDQVTKQLALNGLDDGPVEVIGGVLRFRLTFNPGGAFGLLQSLPELFLVATIGVIATILLWVRRLDQRALLVPLGMILGGGLGNLADRVVRTHEGRVVDFIDFHVWPVFNLADSAIVIGVGLILILGARAERDDDRDAPDGSRGAPKGGGGARTGT